MNRRGGIGIVSTLLAAAWACGAADPDATAVGVDTLPSGAIQVRNPAEGAWEEGAEWRIVEEVRIGSVEAEGPELFDQIADLVVDDHGRIHVLDRGAKEIRVFDAEGEHVRTYGRSGAGPGELGNPIGMISGGAEIRVVDPGNARYAVFDTSGAFVETVPRRVGGSSVPWRGGLDEDGRLWEVSSTFGENGPRRVVLRLDEAWAPRDTFFLPDVEEEAFVLERGRSRMSVGVPFTPSLFFDIAPSGRHVWVGYSAEYRLAKTTLEGDTLLVVEREHEPAPVTDEDLERELERLERFTRQGGKVDRGRIPDAKPPFAWLFATPDGGVWVGQEPDSYPPVDSRFDVFDSLGRYQGRIDSPLLPWPPLFRGDLVYGLDRDTLGVTYVVRTRIER